MARQPRSNLPAAGVYHVTARGVEKRNVYLDATDRRFFLALLDRAAGGARWRILVYCLMTNHFHLVVDTIQERLSEGMHFLNGRYAQAFNDRYERSGHLFQGRFYARTIRDDEDLVTSCDYVLDNPIRAGLCGSRAEWPWLGGEVL